MPEYWDILDENGVPTGIVRNRSLPLFKGEYYRGVSIWIQNSRGEFLISRRSPEKVSAPLKWEATGGGVTAGEDSLTAALREVREELGVCLDPAGGKLFRRYKNVKENGSGSFGDVWFFRDDTPIEKIVLQKGETCDARWATAREIRAMVQTGEFLPARCMDELFKETGVE